MTAQPADDPRAALDPAASASVQASAGSGKTWLLVSRIVRLLLAGAAPGGILALTFTRKAAAEMRQRLTQRLARLADGSDDDLAAELQRIGAPADAATRARARTLHRELLFAPFPPRAMTLDAFAQELLGRFALEADLEPGFTLVEGEDEWIDKAWRRLQQRLLAEPAGPPARALATLVAQGQGEGSLRALVAGFLARRSDWRALVEGRDDAVAHAADRLAEALQHPDRTRALEALDSPPFNMRLKMLCGLLAEAGGVGFVKPDRLALALAASGETRLARLQQALCKEGGDGEPYRFEPRKALPQALRSSLLENHGEVLRVLEPVRDECRRAAALETSAAALTLGQAALEALAVELDSAHALGFAELEWHACRLLRAAGAADWIRYKLDCRIDHLLLDEFQDTSPTQWRMLRPLLEEMAAGNAPADGGRARSLFVVGDPKQSIYGFRRADPGLLREATAWMVDQLGALTRPLHASRRSAPAIIDFVNALFAGDAGLALDFIPHATHRAQDWGRVELAPLVEAAGGDLPEPAPFRDPLELPRAQRDDVRAAQEAALVVARIRQLVADRVEIQPEHGPPRALDYGDVMVLARARTHLRALERALSAAGVPFVGAARGTLLSTSEAADLIALLRHLDAPHRNLELAQVLRSPLFGASDEDLVALAAAARPARLAWRQALATLPAPSPALARARRLLESWQPLAARLPAHDLIDRLLHDTGAAARYEAALPPAARARARANLAALQHLALGADSGRYPSLPRFLRFLEVRQRAALDAPDEAPPPALAGHVRIMTVHAAKGLEAPAVFVVNAGSSPGGSGPRLLVDWPSELERPRLMMLGGLGDALGEQLRASVRARAETEELNLLYVAMTRARQFLHVSGFRGNRRNSWHERASAAMARLGAGDTPAAVLVHETGAPRTAAAPASAPPRAAPDPRLRQRVPSALATPALTRASAGGGPDSAATIRGSAIHWLLQRLSEGGSESRLRAELPARFGPADTAELDGWLAEARAVLATPALAHLFAAGTRAWNEVPLTVDGLGATLDRLVDDGQRLWVVDYKTHPRPQPAALAEQYRPQLAAYADAVRAIWPGREVRAGLVLTATREWVAVAA